MTLVTRLGVLFAVILSVSLFAAALSVWGSRQTQFHVARVSLAHAVLEGYLSLSNNTYQLFKQYGDALIIGDRDQGRGERELVAAIRRDIASLRRIIGSEIDLVGEDEIGELEALSVIATKIEELIVAFDRLFAGESPGSFSADWQELSHMLDAEIDRDFRDLITGALAEEMREVTQTQDEVSRQIVLLRRIAATFAAVSLLAAAASLWTLRYQISGPVAQLLRVVRAFGEGDLGARMRMEGHNELTEIGATFDMMADRIAQNTMRLSEENTSLEAAVANRTEQLERSLEAARRAETNRRRMLADVSHELRTPLTIIKGEADVALRGKSTTPEAYREALTRTRDSASHTARLVDDLLFVARSEEGQVRLKIEDFDLRALVETTMAAFGAAVRIESSVDQAPMRGDRGRISQALLVLQENSRHHGGKDIVVRLDRAPDGWRLAVEDNGPGMSDDEKQNAFERFYRGANAARRYSAGVGLGLPVARSIAAAHGGAITLEDRPGGGLIAVLALPCKQQTAAT